MNKIECPNCVSLKHGVLFATDETTKGIIVGRCKKCGAFITYDANTKEIIKIENPNKKGV